MNGRGNKRSTEKRPPRGGAEGQPFFRRPAKFLNGDKEVDFRDYDLLKRFMSERGKIMPRRTTGATAKQQRQIKRAIRRARVMGLLT